MIVPSIVAVVIIALVLLIGGMITTVGPWYRNLRKPSWNPPDWIFGPAWTIILGLTGWAGVLAWTSTVEARAHAMMAILFAINAALHMLWSPLFFNLKRPDWAMIELPFLWLSIVTLMVGLAPYTSAALPLLAPYLLWVTFAGILNFAIVRMNAPFAPRQVGTR